MPSGAVAGGFVSGAAGWPGLAWAIVDRSLEIVPNVLPAEPS